MKKRKDAPLMRLNQSGIGSLIHLWAAEFHPIFFGKAFDLSVTKHGQTRQGGKHSADAEIFITFSELLDGRFLVRVVHEVDITLQNLRIELKRILDGEAIFIIVFVAQHVHERRVVDTMHAKRADEISFHQPEGFGK